jgi:predicted dehydrogenase
MSRQTNRRQFLQESALAGIGFWVAGGAGSAREGKSGEKLNIACVGVGGKGDSDCDQAGEVGNIVALCDIDDNHLNAKAGKFPRAKKYHDFRKMLEEMGKNIDAVVVSTPDHTHAPASVMAMKLGKHVYCQKPLTHTVFEARKMREVAREYKVCTQMGNQGTAHNELRTSVEIIRAGALGAVKEVHVWTNRPIWPQAPTITRRPESAEPPRHVHWDLFLGPAPVRPYGVVRHVNRKTKKEEVRPAYHPFAWRGWWDFGTGALGDMACHTANMPFMALRLRYPRAVSAESGELNKETYPGWAKVTYEFPAGAETGPIKLTWYEGKKDGKRVLPPADLLHGHKFSDSGCLVVGEKGTLYSPDDYGATRRLLPDKEFKGYKPPKRTLPRTEGDIDLAMKREWAEAIKKKDPTIARSNFDYAGVLTETVLLGNVAIRAGKRLEWDGEAFKVTNDRAANELLHTKYRAGWKL